jgi:hypothetical protein
MRSDGKRGKKLGIQNLLDQTRPPPAKTRCFSAQTPLLYRGKGNHTCFSPLTNSGGANCSFRAHFGQSNFRDSNELRKLRFIKRLPPRGHFANSLAKLAAAGLLPGALGALLDGSVEPDGLRVGTLLPEIESGLQDTHNAGLSRFCQVPKSDIQLGTTEWPLPKPCPMALYGTAQDRTECASWVTLCLCM